MVSSRSCRLVRLLIRMAKSLMASPSLNAMLLKSRQSFCAFVSRTSSTPMCPCFQIVRLIMINR
uniref:Uncharacterized protein n=1 Tax=Arundo donax TaxID=35708 RepID=A0A0A8YFT8_ARUDO